MDTNNNQQVNLETEYIRNITSKLYTARWQLQTARDILGGCISINNCAYKYNDINTLYNRITTQINTFNNIK